LTTKTATPTQPAKHSCPECGKEFESQRSVGPHRRAAHGYRIPSKAPKVSERIGSAAAKDGVKYPCPHCDFIAKWKGGLTHHMQAAHPTVRKSDDGKYPCSDCDKVFDRPSKLGAHRQRKHGVAGSSIAATKREKLLAKRSNELATQTEALPTTVNGRDKETQTVTNGHAIPEATLALGLGRYQGFTLAMAAEFDLPPKLFAAELARLIYHATVRK
jgi:uncharacterized C2H2 Zn-finger protein